jgi:putative addiction module antidote
MFTSLNIRKVGKSLGVILPKEIIQKLNVGEGDRIFVRETANGVELTAYDPEFEKAMEAYKEVSSLYKNALKELAK